jgi:DNA polymerase I
VMAVHGVALRGLEFDTMIAAYLANPISRGLSLSALSLSKLDTEMMPIERVIGKGRRQVTMDRVSIESAAPYAGADADISLQLVDRIQPELRQYEVEALFRDVEMPLVPVLADMERAGVSLDTYLLAEMSADMTAVIGELEGRIYEHAGYRFNIKSTQQLGNLLFKQMKLQTGRRTKAGYSTDSDVLETLRDKDPIVADILEFRTLIKLRDTYVDALPALINARTGKVHTDFNQTAVSTGRLSSSNPNLQNIPVRVELGRQIRRAFVAGGEGRLLLAADYSQIELRVLASMSGDRRLLEAFNSGEDIHVATAAAVFGIPIGEVTSNHRRIAKIVNFGIIYGIGEARLARETGISRQEAAEFIAQYNGTYSGVKSFMDSMRRHAVLHGYVATMLKRRRPIPEIHSQNSGIRTAAERAAINMPIQGTAADIIKLAMIHLHSDLAAHFPDSHMILQVHDELVFDVVAENVEPISALVKRDMEQALGLDVPLEVEMKVGPNWCDMTPLKTAG